MAETSRYEQEFSKRYARGYRDALLDVHDAICSVVPPDERRAAISEVNALLADAVSE